MHKRVLLFLLLIAAFCGARAQTTVSGGVYDFQNKSVPLEKVSVRNLTNKAFSFTDSRGRFTIAAKVNDLLEFTQFGFHADTVLTTNLLSKTVFLTPRPVDIAGVDIKTTKLSPYLSWKDPDAKEYKQVSTDDLHNKKNTDRAGGISLSLGYGKYRRQQAKIAALEEKEMYEDEISYNFNEKNVFDLVKLTGEDLKNFMQMFRPTVDQVRTQRPFNYQFYTVTAYNTWLKLSPEQRKLPQLPKLKSNQ